MEIANVYKYLGLFTASVLPWNQNEDKITSGVRWKTPRKQS